MKFYVFVRLSLAKVYVDGFWFTVEVEADEYRSIGFVRFRILVYSLLHDESYFTEADFSEVYWITFSVEVSTYMADEIIVVPEDVKVQQEPKFKCPYRRNKLCIIRQPQNICR